MAENQRRRKPKTHSRYLALHARPAPFGSFAKLAYSSRPKADSNRLESVWRTGEALPPVVGARYDAWRGVDIVDGIGSIEMLQTDLSDGPNRVRHGNTRSADSRRYNRAARWLG